MGSLCLGRVWVVGKEVFQKLGGTLVLGELLVKLCLVFLHINQRLL
jgi:hypothetical protein